jgi:hypothetical protein
MSLTASPDSPDSGVSVRQSSLNSAIVRTVAYVDVFDYPLAEAEIHRYLIGVPASAPTVAEVLSNGALVPTYLQKWDGYFTLPGREEIVETRRRREEAARRLWPLAIRYGRLIARLPFVRMVAVTGSLAVNNAEPGADIDYLIVTANDRLWLSRAFIILVVRLAARQELPLCPNYLLSERALVFSERNLYTAHELVQMVPLSGYALYQRIRQLNHWTDRWLPNAATSPLTPVDLLPASTRFSGARSLAERGLNSGLGQRLEQWEMRRKVTKFSQAAAAREEAGEATIEANFAADWCKGHFGGHAGRVLEAYARRTRHLGVSE